MKISWSERYSVGFKKIDEQHKYLVDLINELSKIYTNKKDKYEIKKILDKLVSYAITHFNEEESMFIKINYPYTEEHIKEHLQFVNKINEFREMYAKNRISLSKEMLVFLQRWLFDHILMEDKKYQQFINENNIVID